MTSAFRRACCRSRRELRARGHEIAFANPAPAAAKLIASAGFGNLDCPPMYSSVFPKAFAQPTPLVRDYDHFLAMFGWCDPDFTAQEIDRRTREFVERALDGVIPAMGYA